MTPEPSRSERAGGERAADAPAEAMLLAGDAPWPSRGGATGSLEHVRVLDEAQATRFMRQSSSAVLATGGQRICSPQRLAGTPLPVQLRARMEDGLGLGLGAVRVHETPLVRDLGARAFTRGTDLFFAPGAYDPTSTAGLELLGHELAHVRQQALGRVPATVQFYGVAGNDDPALEREADELGARAARGLPQPGARTRALAGSAASTAPIQRQPLAKPKPTYIPFQIIVKQDMNAEEFEAATILQVFGHAGVSIKWTNVKASYTPADSPVPVLLEASLVQKARGEADAAKGMQVDAAGKIAGADDRAHVFMTMPSTDKAGIMAEIDRRYYEASGTSTPIKPKEAGKIELWNQIRDEVLYQQAYLANLPDSVKLLIKRSTGGRKLTPADYEQLFRIAKKIEALPPGAASDYASKITDSTTDLTTFENAIDAYQADLEVRQQEDIDRTEVTDKLVGLEAVYKLYRRYVTEAILETSPYYAATRAALNAATKAAGGSPVETADDMRKQLEHQLPQYGFQTIAEFAHYIDRYVQVFEVGAVRMTEDLLDKYSGKLHQEAERYKDPAVIKALYVQLAPFRSDYQTFEKNAQIWNSFAQKHNDDAEREGLPGNGEIHAAPPTEEQSAALENAKTAKAAAQSKIEAMSKDYPIFAENDLPVDKRLDKAKLAQASETQLAGVLQAHIADRQKVVDDAKAELEDNHDIVFKLDKLMPVFYASMDVEPGSIHDLIIQDKLQDDAIKNLVVGILLAIAAIALAVVSGGTATPALVAAGASIGVAGIDAYMVYDAYKEYTSQHAMAEAGFADDPSTIWLVLAVVGAAVDMAAAAKAVGKLAPAAKTLDSGGELADFVKVVKQLQEQKQIDEKIAEAAERAGAARKAYNAAKNELASALSKAYSFPGPLLDPDVYFALVKMAAAKLREGGASFVKWVAEIKQARAAAKLGELSPEELQKLHEAWGDAEALLASSKNPVDITSSAGKVIGRYQHGEALEIVSKKVLHGGNTIRLDPEATTTVAGTLTDTNRVAERGARMRGITQMGENPGGINLLRSPRWTEIQNKFKPLLDAGDTTGYWRAVSDEFWSTVNKPWLDDAIARGDRFRLISNPADERVLYVTSPDGSSFILDGGQKIRSIFGREVDYLTANGYKILPDGTAVKGP